MSPSQYPFLVHSCSLVFRVVCVSGNPPPGLTGVALEVVPLAPVYEVLDKFSVGSVGSVVPVPDEAGDSRVVRQLL